MSTDAHCRCRNRAQDADNRWWQCIRSDGHEGHCWYPDHNPTEAARPA